MKKRIYIAGKITGLAIQTYTAKFATAAKKLTEAGYEPVNPVEVVNNFMCTSLEAMQKCLPAMMECDAVLMLPCIIDSNGGKIEKQLADYTGIPTVDKIDDLKSVLWKDSTPTELRA